MVSGHTMNTIEQPNLRDHLRAEERQRAWRSAFLYSLDLHADDEIVWEADQWRQLHAPNIAALCDSLLQERRADDFSIPAEVTAAGLTALWQHVSQPKVFRLVRSGAVCLVAGMRLTYWLELTAEEIAA
jgi:hypothetical protein